MTMTPFLSAENVSIGYREKKIEDILSSNINFDLNPGELVCLIGPNGAGKSTLIRTIAGLQPELKGSITLMEHPLSFYSSHQIAQLVSLVLTNPISVMNMTVFDLVSLGRHPFTNWLGQLTTEDKKVIHKALKDVGANQFVDREITQLSDGERQKIMIARALAQQPKVMILDEPTAFLDFPNRVEILAMLRRLANDNGHAVLLSTHDLNLAISVADKMMIMDADGNLAIGAPEDLIINGEFEKAFNPNGSLNFNPLEGTFSFNNMNGHCFAIVADNELLSTWTIKAIERLGFHVDPTAEIIIRAKQQETGFLWILDTGQNKPQFDSIYALIQYLRQ